MPQAENEVTWASIYSRCVAIVSVWPLTVQILAPCFLVLWAPSLYPYPITLFVIVVVLVTLLSTALRFLDFAGGQRVHTFLAHKLTIIARIIGVPPQRFTSLLAFVGALCSDVAKLGKWTWQYYRSIPTTEQEVETMKRAIGERISQLEKERTELDLDRRSIEADLHSSTFWSSGGPNGADARMQSMLGKKAHILALGDILDRELCSLTTVYRTISTHQSNNLLIRTMERAGNSMDKMSKGRAAPIEQFKQRSKFSRTAFDDGLKSEDLAKWLKQDSGGYTMNADMAQ